MANKGNSEPIEVIYRSYQLDPLAPPTATVPVPVVDAYAAKFGGKERAEQILSHLTKLAASEGIIFNMDRALRANTELSHRVLAWTLEKHGSIAQGQLKELILAGYFTNGVNIADTNSLFAIVDSLGLDSTILKMWLDDGNGHTQLSDDHDMAAEKDITAVPTYVIDNQLMIPGAQDVALFERIMTKMIQQ